MTKQFPCWAIIYRLVVARYFARVLMKLRVVCLTADDTADGIRHTGPRGPGMPYIRHKGSGSHPPVLQVREVRPSRTG